MPNIYRKLIALCLALIACLAAPALASGADMPEGAAFTGLPYGNRVDYARVEGWELFKRLEDGDVRIYGRRDGGEGEELLVRDGVLGLVPCGDRFAFYGLYSDGKHKWQMLKPGEEPYELPVSYKDNVFWGDEATVWYAHKSSNGSTRIYSLDHGGKHETLELTVRGELVGRTYAGDVLTVDFAGGRIDAYDGSGVRTLYEADAPLLYAVTSGESVWACFEGGFARIVGGEATRFPGRGFLAATGMAGSEIVMLIPEYVGAPACDVVVASDRLGGYLRLGTCSNVFFSTFEIYEGGFVVQQRESDEAFDLRRDASRFIPYGPE